MKTKSFLTILTCSVLLALPTLADDARIAAYKSQLRGVRVTEVARETARLVAAEKSEVRVAAAADAVTAAVSLSAPSAPLVVGSVAKSSPETAATASGTAVKLQPKLAGVISKAAVSAAPSEVAAIVGAMCQAQPTAFYAIGVNAAAAAPKSSDKILPAITAALPALQPLVARSQADFVAAKRSASLALVLKHAEDMLAAISRDSKETPEALLTGQTSASMATKLASSAVTAPILLPPFVPGGGTPGEIVPAGTDVVPASGRVYSTP